jgi:hypothetical protein
LADRISAPSEFPRLLRRLILETGGDVIGLEFPAGEGVSGGEWDGSVGSGSATAFIPAGLSVWELSVRQDVGTKAEEDYRKRSATPDGTPTTEATDVAPSCGPGRGGRSGHGKKPRMAPRARRAPRHRSFDPRGDAVVDHLPPAGRKVLALRDQLRPSHRTQKVLGLPPPIA